MRRLLNSIVGREIQREQIHVSAWQKLWSDNIVNNVIEKQLSYTAGISETMSHYGESFISTC